MVKNNDRQVFCLSLPEKEAEAIRTAAAEKAISITMLFRMLVRKELLGDPIVLNSNNAQ